VQSLLVLDGDRLAGLAHGELLDRHQAVLVCRFFKAE
jgi:hypothetical protein